MLLLTFIIGGLILLALCHRYSRAGRLIRKIPGPQAWPIMGNCLLYAVPPAQAFSVMRSLPKKYGHLNQIHGLNVRIVNVSNPEDLEKIMSTPEYNNKKTPYTFFIPWLADGLLVSNGNKWQQRRKMLTRAFHFSVLKKFTEIFKSGAERFLNRVERETLADKTDVLAFISPTALRVMCETAMGLSMGEDTPAMSKYFDAIFGIGECFALRTSRMWLHNEVLFGYSQIAKIQKGVIEDLHEFTMNVINDRRKMLEEKYGKQENKDETYETNEKLAMLDLLLENEKMGLITSEGIREEVDTFMFEGFDTTSLTLTYIIMALANEPEIQAKIYKEMQEVFGDSNRMPSAEDLNEMKYLENCIKETMRLYPAAPLIVRHLVNDTVLSGYNVPAGTDCFLFIYDLHRREDLFPDPERFDPDRFLPENSVNRSPYAYIPFSAGQRNCIGQKFAMLELKILMSSLLRKYRLEPVTRPCDIRFKFDIVLRTQDPIYVKFRSRK